MTTKRGARTGREVAKRDALTDKQRLFVEAYFANELNGTEAAMQVYNPKDRDVAASMASDLLSLPKVRALVDQRLDQFHLSANEVLARLAFHARGSMDYFLDPDSLTIDLRKAKQAKQLGLIKKFRSKITTFTDKDGGESETIETEIELYDAQAALVHIGKHLGLFSADVNINFNMLTDEQLEALASGKKVDRIVSIEAGK